MICGFLELSEPFRGRNGAWHNPVDQYAKDLAKIVTGFELG